MNAEARGAEEGCGPSDEHRICSIAYYDRMTEDVHADCGHYAHSFVQVAVAVGIPTVECPHA